MFQSLNVSISAQRLQLDNQLFKIRPLLQDPFQFHLQNHTCHKLSSLDFKTPFSILQFNNNLNNLGTEEARKHIPCVFAQQPEISLTNFKQRLNQLSTHNKPTSQSKRRGKISTDKLNHKQPSLTNLFKKTSQTKKGIPVSDKPRLVTLHYRHPLKGPKELSCRAMWGEDLYEAFSELLVLDEILGKHFQQFNLYDCRGHIIDRKQASHTMKGPISAFAIRHKSLPK